jgi:PleD family two-component response regulator
LRHLAHETCPMYSGAIAEHMGPRALFAGRQPIRKPDMAESASSRPPLALIANDQEWSIRSLESILAPHGYAILRAYTGRQTLDLARETTPDLIIIDANFPDMSGIDVCRILRTEPRVGLGAPILITTAGPRTRQQRLEALREGAWDLLSLPVDAEELVLRLKASVALKFEVDRTREEGLVDNLTGLYNLRGLMRRARELGSDAYRHGRALACVAFAPDLRNGEDLSLTEDQRLWTAVDLMAHVFKDTGRISDAVGRIRFGEFVVIAPGTDETGALKMAQRLTAAIEAAERREEFSGMNLLAGYDAVADVRESGTQPAALMAGATTALRQSQAEPSGPAIRRYAANGEGILRPE